jgi:hypothetical protein
MRLTILTAALVLGFAAGAQQPVPDLRVEAVTAGSVFFVRNGSAQPLTAFLIELVNYPGSSYTLWQDDLAAPVPPGGEKRIPVSSMTVGAVPDYVKLQAALYADGSSSGVAAKVTELIERRRTSLVTTRELIRRLEEQSQGAAELKQWADSIPAPTRATRNTLAAINQAVAKALIDSTTRAVELRTLREVLARLHLSERALAASNPALQ